MFFTKTSHTTYFNAAFFIASNMKQGINLNYHVNIERTKSV